MTTIRQIEPGQQELWNKFVLDSPAGTYFHLYEWSEIIGRTYGFDTPFLGAYTGKELVAVLPVVVTKKTSGHAVSLAFGTYGGWLIAPGVDEGSIQRAFMEFLAGRGITRLENRLVGGPTEGAPLEHVTQRTKLAQSPDELWKRLDPKVRNQVRKAQKEGLEARWGSNQLEDFYSIFSINMHHLGTPPHALSFFSAVLKAFRNNAQLLTIRLGDKPLAAMFLMKFGKQLSDPWAASLREYASLCPNMLMYWEAMKHGCEHGFDEFDLGRSKVGSGPFRFKTQWGAEPISLNYQVFTLSPKGILSAHPPGSSSVLPFVSKLWKFVPLGLSIRLGPVLRKRIA